MILNRLLQADSLVYDKPLVEKQIPV
jgi:hypothetical protein